MQEYALIFMTIDDMNNNKRISLTTQRSGMWKNYLNGFGGKFDSSKDKDTVDTAIRNLYKSTGIGTTYKYMDYIASVKFSEDDNTYSHIHVYTTEFTKCMFQDISEINWKWYLTKKLPFHKLPETDIYWLRDAFRYLHIDVNINVNSNNTSIIESIKFNEIIQ